jgi:hypothetical protein
MLKSVSSVLLSVALLTPVAAYAQDHRTQDHENQSKRYYDSKHKDYHEWNANEDKSYHQYLSDNHKPDHDWAKASKKEQNSYWDWRHQHPDAH